MFPRSDRPVSRSTMERILSDVRTHQIINVESIPPRRSFSEVTEGVPLEITAIRQLSERELISRSEMHYDPVYRSVASSLADDNPIKLISPSREMIASLMAERLLNPVSRCSGLTCVSGHRLSVSNAMKIFGLDEISVDLSFNDKHETAVCIGLTEEPGVLHIFISPITGELGPAFFMQDSVKDLIWNMLAVHIRFGVKIDGEYLVLLELLEQESYDLQQANLRAESTLSVGIAYLVLRVDTRATKMKCLKGFLDGANDAKNTSAEPRIFEDVKRFVDEYRYPPSREVSPTATTGYQEFPQ